MSLAMSCIDMPGAWPMSCIMSLIWCAASPLWPACPACGAAGGAFVVSWAEEGADAAACAA